MTIDRTPPQNPGRGRITRNLKPVPADPDDDCDMDSIPDPPAPKGKASTGTVAASNPKPSNGPPIKGGSLFDQLDEDEEENHEDEDSLSTASHEEFVSPSITALLAKKNQAEQVFQVAAKSSAENGVCKNPASMGKETQSSPKLQDFANSSFADEDRYKEGTLVPTWVKQVCKTGTEMMVLAQLAYWFRRGPNGIRARKLLGETGYRWVAKSYADLAQETGLETHQVRQAVKTLTVRKIIVYETHRFGGLVMNHFRLDPDAIDEALMEVDAE